MKRTSIGNEICKPLRSIHSLTAAMAGAHADRGTEYSIS